MYTESRNNFSIRSVILQFLFVALLVFILIWLFPTKTDMKKATSSSDNKKVVETDLSVIKDRIFNENLTAMKEAAQSYFTTERLPLKEGDTVKLTLKEMLDKKIILPFTDKDGKQCDTKASYVSVTKKGNEYIMKVNLKCGSEENYLLVYMGCYDYCSLTICEKKGTVGKVYKVTTEEPKTYYCKVVNGKYYDNKGTIVSKALYDKACTKKVTKYYCKIVNGKYYDNKGNVVTKAAYEKACLPTNKYYCKVVNGKYYDNKGNAVTKKAYEKACSDKKYYCTIVDGKYYNSLGTEVTYTAYSKDCLPNYYCQIVNGKYYDLDGNVVSESKFKETCYKTTYNSTYEYKLVVEGTTKYSDWSEWSTTKYVANKTTEVESRTDKYKKLIGYKVKKVLVNDLTKPIKEKKDVLVGETTVTACTAYNVTSTITGYNEKYIGTVKLSKAPTSTTTVRYEAIGTYQYYCDPNCTSGTVYLYKVYQREPITTSTYSCAKKESYTTAYATQKTVITGYEKKEETTKEKVYDEYTKTFYRFRTLSLTPGTITIKWSKYNDTVLLNAGYKYTGNYKIEKIVTPVTK